MNEIEQKFFETFEIPKSQYCIYAKLNRDSDSRYYCSRDEKECWTYPDNMKCGIRSYPEITDRILLELIRINNNWGYFTGYFDTVEDFKLYVLKNLVELFTVIASRVLVNEVQALFKEAERRNKNE